MNHVIEVDVFVFYKIENMNNKKVIEMDLGGYENSCEHERQCRKLIN